MTNCSVYNENIRLEPKTALDGKLAKTHVVFFLLTRKRRKQPIHAEKFVYHEFAIFSLEYYGRIGSGRNSQA